MLMQSFLSISMNNALIVFNVAIKNNFQLRGSFQKLKYTFVRLILANLLCHILAQLHGMNPQTHSNVPQLLIK